MGQQTDFDFEIIVGDDCSTDGTSDVVADYARRYPGRIIHVRHPNNVGAFSNYIYMHQMAAQRAEYIAHMDGDDYALPGKLSCQVKVLDANPAVSISAHAVKIIGEKRCNATRNGLPVLATLERLLMLGTYFVNSSTMYRAKNSFSHDIEQDIVDFYIHIEQASKGLIHFNKLQLGGYRDHVNGISKQVEYRRRIESAYEVAFDRALTLGANVHIVKQARLQRRMRMAVGRFLAGDVDGYKKLIQLEAGERPHASIKHGLLFRLRRYPALVHIYFALKRA